MIHPTPAKVLLATTLQPLVVQLSGSLARGAKLIDQFLHHERLFKKFSLWNGTGFPQAMDVVHVVLGEHVTHFKKSRGTFCAPVRAVR
jgi:hypothetical protein